MSNAPRPPAQIQPYVDVLGVEGTIEFLLEFGGAELILSQAARSGRLVRLVGHERAAQLVQHAGHLPRRVPLAKRWIAAVWREQGLAVAQIARRLHVSDVTVRAYLKRSAGGARRPDPRQLDLF